MLVGSVRVRVYFKRLITAGYGVRVRVVVQSDIMRCLFLLYTILKLP